MTAADLSDRQQEVLSYLQGLGSVGEPVAFEIKQVAADLRVSSDVIRRSIHLLTANRFIALVDKQAALHTYRVIRRLEQRGPDL